MPRLWTVSKSAVLFLGVWLLLAGFASWAGAAEGPRVPNPRGYVNDFADALSDQEEAVLTDISASLEQSTTAQLVYVIMPSIAPYDDFTYGMAIYDAWKIGQKGKDNGLLILLAMKERRVRIIPGYGLESILPDGKLGRYRDSFLMPLLKQGKPGEGLANIGLAISQEIAKDAGVKLKGAAARQPKNRQAGKAAARLIVFIVFMIFITIIGRINRKRMGKKGYRSGAVFIPGGYYRGGGGGFGGGFGGFGGGFSGGGGVGGGW